MTKLKAFATHLGISLVIFLIILAVIVFYWYPPPFFSSDGGWQGIRIIAAVDLVLGPVLTLIVFKPGKPGLKFDLTVIGLVQTAALAWGLWAVHHERPVAAVFTENKFTTLTSYELSQDVTMEKLRRYGPRPPVWIYSDLPEDTDKLQEIRLRALQSGRTIDQFSEYYQPINAEAIRKIQSKAVDMQKWVLDKEAARKVYESFLDQHKDNKENISFYIWSARHGNKIIALNTKTLAYIKLLDIDAPTIEDEIKAK